MLRLSQEAGLVGAPLVVRLPGFPCEDLHRDGTMDAVVAEEDHTKVTVPEPFSDLQLGDNTNHSRFLAAITSMAASRLIFLSVPPCVCSLQKASSSRYSSTFRSP